MNLNERQIVAFLADETAPQRYDALTEGERLAAGLAEGTYIVGPSHIAPLLLQVIGNPVLPNFIDAELVIDAEGDPPTVCVVLTDDVEAPEAAATLERVSHPIDAKFLPIIAALMLAADAESGGETIWLDALDAFEASITDRGLRQRFARMDQINARLAARLKAADNGAA